MIKISPSQRTSVLISLVQKGKIPARARQYSDDIIKSHCRGIINDNQIQSELIELGFLNQQEEPNQPQSLPVQR